MPNMATVTLTDGTTPIAFRPDSVSATNALLMENNPQKPLNELAKVNYDRPKNGNTTRRTMRINLPFKVTGPDGAEEVIWLTFRGEAIADTRATAAMRGQLLSYAASGISDSAFIASFGNPEWFW